MNLFNLRILGRAALLIFVVALLPAAVWAAGPIVLDGNFLDWVGQPCVNDPNGDQYYNPGSDLVQFCFANNPDDPTAYFMARRAVNDGQDWTLMHLIDTDQDGYANKVLWVDYRPLTNNSRVDVWLYDYDNGIAKVLNNNDNLGESTREGGTRVEYGISFTDLGIYPGQTIDMQIWSLNPGGYVSDYSQIVTWSPADALGWLLLGAFAFVAVIGMTVVRVRM